MRTQYRQHRRAPRQGTCERIRSWWWASVERHMRGLTFAVIAAHALTGSAVTVAAVAPLANRTLVALINVRFFLAHLGARHALEPRPRFTNIGAAWARPLTSRGRAAQPQGNNLHEQVKQRTSYLKVSRSIGYFRSSSKRVTGMCTASAHAKNETTAWELRIPSTRFLSGVTTPWHMYTPVPHGTVD